MLGRKSDITFELDEETGKLTVMIDTKRLHLESVVTSDTEHYAALLSDADNMAKFGTGAPWDDEKTEKRVASWVTRWEGNDPFSSLKVSLKDDATFIGHVVLGYGDEPGQSEMAYVFDKKFWGKGYGKEAVAAVVVDFAPELVGRGYTVEDKPFASIVATSRPDNPASCQILSGIGMKSIKEEVKFGHNRHTFFVTTDELVKRRNEQHVSVNAFGMK